jgi:hypothetical protein
VGPVEQGVIDECAALAAAQDRPGVVMITRMMARIVDDPDCQWLHARASRELEFNMSFLRPKKQRKSRGSVVRLSAVKHSVNQGN